MDKHLLLSSFLSLRDRLLAIATPIVGRDAADDALQDAFLRLWQRREHIADGKVAEGMSIVTVKHLAIDEARRKEREFSIQREHERSHGAADELFEEVRTLIFSQMDERQAAILWHRDFQQWDFEEIAEKYSLTEANVRKIVSRARKEIREIYRRRNER